MLLEGKVAVIYGGGGAIGSTAARVFAREGASLFLAGRGRQRLEGVARDIGKDGGRIEIAELDILDEAAVNAHAADVAGRAGGIDIMLNAVSFAHDQGTTIDKLSIDTFMLPIDRYLRSMFIASRAVAPHMGGKRPGIILSVSAPAARLAVGGHLGHAASQAGIEAFSRTLADELGPRNIRVVCLRSHALVDAPAAGSFTGPMFRDKAATMGMSVDQWLGGAAQMTMLKRLPTLSEFAETAAFLASPRAGAITGAVANLTCGAVAD
jgi:NAD(P)-dependent dehydrogenase (short-subunit alcohol dehydrogenase family)